MPFWKVGIKYILKGRIWLGINFGGVQPVGGKLDVIKGKQSLWG